MQKKSFYNNTVTEAGKYLAENYTVKFNAAGNDTIYCFDGNQSISRQPIGVLVYHEKPEFTLCISGSGALVLDNHVYMIEAGDIIFIRPGAYHYSISLTSEPLCSKVLWVDPPAALKCAGINDILKLNTLDKYDIPGVISRARYPDIHDTLLRMITEYDGGRNDKEELCGLYLYEFILKLPRYFQKREHGPEKPDDLQIINAYHYIMLHFSEEISNGILAKICHMSISNFLRRFKAVSGMTPHMYINKFRVETAAYLLKNEDMSVSDVCEICGFLSPSVLYRNFYRHYGCSPTKFKKLKREPDGNGTIRPDNK